MRTSQNIIKSIDKPLLILYLLMVGMGWFNIFSAEYSEAHTHVFNLGTNYGKQLLFIITSLVLAAVIILMDVRFFTSFSWIIYGVFLLLLIAVLIAGVEINATKAWFRFGSFSFQPSEVAKYGTALALASYMSKQKSRPKGFSTHLKTFLIVLIPAALVLLQKDVGTTLVFTSFVLVYFREGYIGGPVLFFIGLAVILFVLTLIVNEFVIIGVLAGIMLIIALFLHNKTKALFQLAGLFIVLSIYVYSVDYTMNNILQPHHRARIEVLLYEGMDLQGAGYNLHQSKIAIGSGGLWGKGYMQGTQTQFNFIPEQSTDFIFCTVGEEWGFVGSTFIIMLFITLLLRIIYLAEKQKSTFSRVFGYATASIVFFHFAINIGMTIGLVPVIGIPLPMISYGGSSLWGITLFIFTMIKLDTQRLEML